MAHLAFGTGAACVRDRGLGRRRATRVPSGPRLSNGRTVSRLRSCQAGIGGLAGILETLDKPSVRPAVSGQETGSSAGCGTAAFRDSQGVRQEVTPRSQSDRRQAKKRATRATRGRLRPGTPSATGSGSETPARRTARGAARGASSDPVSRAGAPPRTVARRPGRQTRGSGCRRRGVSPRDSGARLGTNPARERRTPAFASRRRAPATGHGQPRGAPTSHPRAP